MNAQDLVQAWRNLDESLEVSAVVNGIYFHMFIEMSLRTGFSNLTLQTFLQLTSRSLRAS